MVLEIVQSAKGFFSAQVKYTSVDRKPLFVSFGKLDRILGAVSKFLNCFRQPQGVMIFIDANTIVEDEGIEIVSKLKFLGIAVGEFGLCQLTSSF